MTRVPFPLAFAALAVALALTGCATTGSGGADITGASAADAQPSSAIEGTRVASTGPAIPRAEDPSALRVPARVMRIWIAPWEDSRGDLHAPGYLYTEIEPRRWTPGAPPRSRDDLDPPAADRAARCARNPNALRPRRRRDAQAGQNEGTRHPSDPARKLNAPAPARAGGRGG